MTLRETHQGDGVAAKETIVLREVHLGDGGTKRDPSRRQQC